MTETIHLSNTIAELRLRFFVCVGRKREQGKELACLVMGLQYKSKGAAKMKKIPGKIDVYADVEHCAKCKHFTQTCNRCGCGVCCKSGSEVSKLEWCEEYNK